MKASLLGFVWELGKGIALDEFFAYLAQRNGQETKFGPYNRLLFVGERGNYHVGLFLTIKDQRRVPEITANESGEFVVTVRSLEEGNNLLDFNFFAINKVTCRGLYQHYHNSCSLNQFGIFCRREYEDLRTTNKEAVLAKMGGDEAPQKDKKKVSAQFKGTLRWEVMIRKENLAELLEELERISSFEYDVTSFSVVEPTFEPIKQAVKRETHTIRFVAGTRARVVTSTIVQAVSALNVVKGRVTGRDDEGIEKTFRLLENPDSFGRYEYDEIADETVLKLKDVQTSPFFDEMFGVIEKNRPMFEE